MSRPIDQAENAENFLADTVHEHPHFGLRPYSVLMTGPSGSGDIGAIVVHPAQGVRTLTVILSPARNASKRKG
jgi:L-lactate dehydrogenase complex protein LldG